ncbi:MAG TPA: serine hydrolase domain-containing protein [Pyrinomonadaceae bacterium]|nr:serine hydrolase domain-containing protein [Pyrinomonadaceae bacterium]
MRQHHLPFIVILLLLAAAPVAADQADDYITAAMRRRNIPALALCVLRDGKVVKQKAYGQASVELGVPATTGTVFPLASITKTFTAAGIMALVEERKVSLDDPARRFLPRLPPSWAGVTVRHLLTHTSGLPDVVVDDDLGTYISETREDALKKLAAVQLSGRPGTKSEYNETNYVLLAMIIEKLSGLSYEQYMNGRFFRPLDMGATAFGDTRELIPHRASVYTRYQIREGKSVLSPGKLWNYQYVYPAYTYAGAGLNASLADLIKWDAALGEGRVLKPATLEQMWTAAKLKNGRASRLKGPAVGWGAGWMVNDAPHHKAVFHTGGDASAYARFLDDKLSVIILTNCQGAEPATLLQGVAALYAPALAGGKE